KRTVNRMINFKETPKCEVCKKNEATAFSFIKDYSKEGEKGQWKFSCNCTNSTERYYIMFEDFFSDPSKLVNKLAHMHQKTWMDWNNFMDMMTRFRAALSSAENKKRKDN
ncbi:MAG TPA: hypothetical protein VK469_03980, partial [Candidatus Kapabacteria bacterium]|nr:hypothetical protein [Candidatus Kapabacteria bacterium]